MSRSRSDLFLVIIPPITGGIMTNPLGDLVDNKGGIMTKGGYYDKK